MKRDFTYIDDVIESVFRLIKKVPPTKEFSFYKIYNIGNQQPIALNDFIQMLEEQLGKKAILTKVFYKKLASIHVESLHW